MAEKIAIVGAGISGATAARTLSDRGHNITLYEKSGGTGGRLSTRRTEFGDFDHGAQYVTARGMPFRALMTGLSNASAVSFWKPEGKDRENDWHVGTPGMSSLVKPLLSGIDLRLRTRVSEIVRDGKDMICIDENAKSDRHDRVIVAIPSPQACDLLSSLDGTFSELRSVQYMPCWAGMFAFDGRVETLPNLFRGDDTQTISWLARNNSKPDRSGPESICAQAGAVWSRDNLELDPNHVLELMRNALDGMAGKSLTPVYAATRRWRYARVDRSLGKPFLASADDRIFAIGDGMLGGRVEAAFESARQLCEYLKS